MSLKVSCYLCGHELEKPGAIVLSPPLLGHCADDSLVVNVSKYHICSSCWKWFVRAVLNKAKESRQFNQPKEEKSKLTDEEKNLHLMQLLGWRVQADASFNPVWVLPASHLDNRFGPLSHQVIFRKKPDYFKDSKLGDDVAARMLKTDYELLLCAVFIEYSTARAKFSNLNTVANIAGVFDEKDREDKAVRAKYAMEYFTSEHLVEHLSLTFNRLSPSEKANLIGKVYDLW